METTYSEKLRALADYLDEHPEIAEKTNGYWDYPSIWVSCGEDTEEFGRLCRAMGSFEKNKSSWDNSLSATYAPENEDGDRLFKVNVGVTGACTKVVKLDENGEPVTKKVTKTVPVETVEVEEEEVQYEWQCPESFLAL